MQELDIQNALYAGITADATQFGTPSAWRFSDLGKCNRCQVLKRLGYHDGDLTFKQHFLFAMGHKIEDMALVWLQKSRHIDILSRQVRVEFLEKYDAKGTMDALGLFNNSLVPIEIKSTRDRALEYRIPYHNHELQTAGYCLATGLPRGIIVYLGRDGGFASAIVQAERFAVEIFSQWDTLNSFWQAIPEREWYIEQNIVSFDGHMPLTDELEQALPPRPGLVPALDKSGQPIIYKRGGPWGPAGTVKMEKDKTICVYCMYPGLCCDAQERENQVQMPLVQPQYRTPDGDGLYQGLGEKPADVRTVRENLPADEIWHGIPESARMKGPWIEPESGTPSVSSESADYTGLSDEVQSIFERPLDFDSGREQHENIHSERVSENSVERAA